MIPPRFRNTAYANGVETCDGSTGTCQPGTPPFPDDARGFMCSACLFLRGIDNAQCATTQVPAGVKKRFTKAAKLDANQAVLPINSAKSRRLGHRRVGLLKKAFKRAGTARHNSAITEECFDELTCRIGRVLCLSCDDACPVRGGQVSCP